MAAGESVAAGPCNEALGFQRWRLIFSARIPRVWNRGR
eukprot:CAMPEP_0204596300 /NCGR_PEP_ID=MMETSP0661-20131031/53163_1 /ASSEMBLY_ACC=CAM_ASM_000606 /TAXON_ID=109239 /ORGANISM="Alexandrium margalefi, Strain AMGDE01CS-322" /LENGTH=37 /DNA_ID= /DNA_START= /DNA_END= /DNA_ORIENTATION=